MEKQLEKAYQEKNEKKLEIKNKINKEFDFMTFPIPKEKKSKLQKSKLDIFEDIDKYEELNEKIRNLEREILKLKNEKK